MYNTPLFKSREAVNVPANVHDCASIRGDERSSACASRAACINRAQEASSHGNVPR